MDVRGSQDVCYTPTQPTKPLCRASSQSGPDALRCGSLGQTYWLCSALMAVKSSSAGSIL